MNPGYNANMMGYAGMNAYGYGAYGYGGQGGYFPGMAPFQGGVPGGGQFNQYAKAGGQGFSGGFVPGYGMPGAGAQTSQAGQTGPSGQHGQSGASKPEGLDSVSSFGIFSNSAQKPGIRWN